MDAIALPIDAYDESKVNTLHSVLQFACFLLLRETAS
jgi:hypothetical protein